VRALRGFALRVSIAILSMRSLKILGPEAIMISF